MDTIGKVIATEKQPSTIETFTFWTKKDLKMKKFVRNSLLKPKINDSRFTTSAKFMRLVKG